MTATSVAVPADEYRTLLDPAGFRMTRVVPTASDGSVVEAVVK